LAAVMQGVHSNYQIDLFQNLMRAAAQLAGVKDLDNSSLRVIADHIRACAFLVLDGVTPSNEGRGYVLRRIIRRALRHGNTLGLKQPFFHKLVAPLAQEMGQAYPELPRAEERIERALKQEEERFAETLEQGLHILEQDFAGLKGKMIPGATVFKLYDTYGFPVDLTADIARERGLSLDMPGFEREMEAQRQRARAASHFEADYSGAAEVGAASEFIGYEHLIGTGKVLALLRDGDTVNELKAGETGMVILDRTPFYAESGGQAGDQGVLRAKDVQFAVSDTRKLGAAHGHFGVLKSGKIKVGDALEAEVNAARRHAIMLNHSATHLLHAALRQVLGEHVTQKGSLVEAERLRFDFSHFEPITPEQLHSIEALVNRHIRANHPGETRVMALDEAMKAGAMALFGEKYGERVRVLRFGEFSTELCGGTHVRATGDIGLFKIVSEGGVASGVRRIEAVTGEHALAWVEQTEHHLMQVAEMLKAGRDNVEDKVRQLLDKTRKLEKELDQLKGKLASGQGADLADRAEQVKGIKVLAARLDGADAKALRETADKLRDKLKSCALVLGTVADGKVSLIAAVTPDLTAKIKAGDLVNAVATQVGGKGGGKSDMAQAGGVNPEALEGALRSVPNWVREQLAAI
ncbi:MAG: alanine--tRNA ligase, partial [Gammaproteobacteria bacterium]